MYYDKAFAHVRLAPKRARDVTHDSSPATLRVNRECVSSLLLADVQLHSVHAHTNRSHC